MKKPLGEPRGGVRAFLPVRLSGWYLWAQIIVTFFLSAESYFLPRWIFTR